MFIEIKKYFKILFKLKLLLYILLSSWSIGIGLRLCFNPPFNFNIFDRIFDFLLLAILGILNLLFIVNSFFKGEHNK